MEHLLQLIKKRLAPGILILDLHGGLRYSNKEALELLPHTVGRENTGSLSACLPLEILNLCSSLRTASDYNGSEASSTVECCYPIVIEGAEQFFSLRAFPVSSFGTDSAERYVMVLIDRVVEKHAYDFDKVRTKFRLTIRELEVVRNLCEGLTNRAIAEKLYVSENTIKDHLKNIMVKMQVRSRSAILAALKNLT